MRIIVVCEAPADFELASCLISRSLRQHGPSWYEDLPQIADFSGWAGSRRSRHALWTEIESHYVAGGGRPLLGRRRGPYSIPAAKAIILAGKEASLNALILMIDLDREAERRNVLIRVREEAVNSGFRILLATPDPKREAWVLHGFEPGSTSEIKKLAKLQEDLGFDPRQEPHRLRDDARRGETRRDIKQVLEHLTDGNRERESGCWEQTDLAVLEARGEETHLAPFLREIREQLLPPSSSSRS